MRHAAVLSLVSAAVFSFSLAPALADDGLTDDAFNPEIPQFSPIPDADEKTQQGALAESKGGLEYTETAGGQAACSCYGNKPVTQKNGVFTNYSLKYYKTAYNAKGQVDNSCSNLRNLAVTQYEIAYAAWARKVAKDRVCYSVVPFKFADGSSKNFPQQLQTRVQQMANFKVYAGYRVMNGRRVGTNKTNCAKNIVFKRDYVAAPKRCPVV